MPQQIDVPGMGIVEFPDGMSDEQISTAIRSNMAAPVSTAEDVGKSALAGVGKGASSLLGAVGDLSDAGARGIGAATNFVERKLGLPESAPYDPSKTILSKIPGSADVQRVIEGVTGPFYEPKTTLGRYGGSVGEMIPASMLGPSGIAGKIMSAVGAGVGGEAGADLTKGTKLEPAGRIAGALMGGVAPLLAGRAVTPLPAAPVRQGMVQQLADEGVMSLTAGQRTGNKAIQYLEDATSAAPFAGGGATRIRSEGQRQFTEAAMRRAGAGPDAAPEVLAANSRRLGDTFRDLSNRNDLVPDNQFITDITAAVRNYRRVPDSQQRQMLQGYVDDIIDHVNAGQMPGPQYQEMRSRLSRQSNSLRQSDPTLSEALRDMRNSLDNAMSRSIGPADQEAWQTARREYGAQKVLEKTASRAGEATGEGQIVPANLRNTVAAENRGAYARGEGPFADLSRAGSVVMAPLPNSGTAQRSNAFNILNQTTLGLVPAITGRAIMSRPAQAYLANQIMTGGLNGNRLGPQSLVEALLAPSRLQLSDQSR